MATKPRLTKAEQKQVREWLRAKDPIGTALDQIERRLRRLERQIREHAVLTEWLRRRAARLHPQGGARGRSK